MDASNRLYEVRPYFKLIFDRLSTSTQEVIYCIFIASKNGKSTRDPFIHSIHKLLLILKNQSVSVNQSTCIAVSLKGSLALSKD
jgi:hypothetical protein